MNIGSKRYRLYPLLVLALLTCGHSTAATLSAVALPETPNKTGKQYMDSFVSLFSGQLHERS